MQDIVFDIPLAIHQGSRHTGTVEGDPLGAARKTLLQASMVHMPRPEEPIKIADV
jgi:hypothetical protein